MAAEDIGTIYNTKIPGLEDAADIQAALKLYHYGSTTYDVTNTDLSQLPNPSLARHLKNIQDHVNAVDTRGIGSAFVATEPQSPIEGFVWVDSTSAGASEIIYSTVFYTNIAPTENLVDGIVWVDKSSITKSIYVWDSSLSEWVSVNELANIVESKGDLIVGDSSGVAVKLPVGTNGYYLVADSGSSTGMSWQQLSITSQEIADIMGVY